jgi:hypothetical protein
VLTLDSGEALRAGCEVPQKGIEVRVAERGLGSESLTLHIFETSKAEDARALINHHVDDEDKPVLIKGSAPVAAFRSQFDAAWRKGRPLESVLAQQILPLAGGHQGPEWVLHSLEKARAELHLDQASIEKIMPHLAFRDSCAIVFIVGLPGSGKSFVRRRLEAELKSMRIECGFQTDYPFAYLEFIRQLLRLNPSCPADYTANDDGSFTARNEEVLAPPLREVAGVVRDHAQLSRVTLVEFARADLLTALRQFESADLPSQLIYVDAPAKLRLTRLNRRVVPPVTTVGGEQITISLSDNHRLPASARNALYAADDFPALKMSRDWHDRITEIKNSRDNDINVDAGISEFVNKIVDPYTSASRSA